ncbi:MAG TPA: proliferating cell nuclear antigen (pcna) [Candidatus Nanoarchaeia archaeon]|nr:proliferating cell nuclear antigen (pcna) [Candidatus Nanoarchaeia archaeon]
MKLTLEEPRILTELIGIISELVNEVHFRVDKEKIEVVAMDPANVAMVIFRLLGSAFKTYQVDKPVKLALSLDALKTILKRAKPSDLLSLELDSERNKLKITISGESKRTFNIALIDVDEKEQKIPELKFPLKIETNSVVFDEAINDMDVISEAVSLGIDKDKFVVEAESNLNDARVEIGTDTNTKIQAGSKSEVKARYSLEYLKRIIKGSKLANTVILQFDKDYPLKVDYIVKDKLSLSFILAPRVSND